MQVKLLPWQAKCTTIKQVKNNASYAIKRNFISWVKFKAESIKQTVSFIVDVEFKATSRYILKETVKNDKKEPNNENSRSSHRILEFYYTYQAIKKIGLFLHKKDVVSRIDTTSFK